jgi:hypothetical protein
LAERGERPVQRAWLIVAAARQRRGRHRGAIDAYREFLGACAAADEREYVLRQIDRCAAALRPRVRRRPPSEWLSAEEKADLAEVEDDFFTETSRHFIIRAKNEELPKLLAREAERSLQRICTVILRGQAYPHVVDLTVWADRKEYLANASDSPEWAGGSFTYAQRDGAVTRRIDLTQCDAAGAFDTEMLDRVLPHEMCHLVVKEYFGDAACPLFLNEGLAMMAEHVGDPRRAVLAGAALAGEKGIPLADLFVAHRADLAAPRIFYAEAFSFTGYLHARLTARQFRDVLEHIKDGCAVADAIQRALYAPPRDDFLARLAAAWTDHAITDAQFLRALGDGLELSAR